MCVCVCVCVIGCPSQNIEAYENVSTASTPSTLDNIHIDILYIKTRWYLQWNIQAIVYILFKILDLERFQFSSIVPM